MNRPPSLPLLSVVVVGLFPLALGGMAARADLVVSDDRTAGGDDAGRINLLSGQSLDLSQTGSLDMALTNNGTVNGPTLAGEFVTFADDVDGAGRYTGNVQFAGGFRPGNSPSVVPFEGNLSFGTSNPFTVELAGTALGEFDRLVVSGDVSLAGTLIVELIDPFTLSLGQTFEIIDVGGDLTGQFIGLGEDDLVGNFGGVGLFISYAAGDGNNVVLSTAAIPEAAWVGAVGVLLASLCGGWSRRARRRHSQASSHCEGERVKSLAKA